MKTQMKKQKTQAFGKNVYLLGQDKEGTLYWLEAPSWDCDWYWGFGYIETYTYNKRPGYSKDISSHQHARDFYPKWVLGENPILSQTTVNDREKWELAELFSQFYLLKNMAEFCHKKPVPGSHIATVKDVDHGDLTEWYKKINNEMIPRITEKIIEILTP